MEHGVVKRNCYRMLVTGFLISDRYAIDAGVYPLGYHSKPGTMNIEPGTLFVVTTLVVRCST